MIINEIHNNMLSSPVRKLEGRVEVHQGSTLALICGCHNHLSKFTIERLGEEGKFFGFGICQKLTAVLIDKNREINVSKENYLEAVFGVGENYLYPCPRFNVVDAKRDENNNQLTITAYDDLYAADTIYVKDLELPASYTLRTFVVACGAALGLPINANTLADSSFDLALPQGGNFTGNETVRKALNAVAEATQTIYYVNKDWELTFKRPAATSVMTIDKSKYFTLKGGDARKITTLAHITDLGDNIFSTTGTNGDTQYIRNNPFWDWMESADIATQLDSAVARIGDFTINQFECDWRGNYLVEIGDGISFTTKDDGTIFSLLVNDELTFNGSLSQKSKWNYIENEGEAAENPTTLGDALNQTYAKVDKTNKRIDLVVSDTNGKISSLQLTTESITARVEDNEDKLAELEITAEGISGNVEGVEERVDDITGDLTVLTKEVETKVTADGVSIQINQSLADGVSKVDTGTGFVFDEAGLTIQKTENDVVGEMKTQITEDGMTVYRSEEAVLVANNQGVNAENLHATTWLIVGGRSRFENYGSDRTGCFWIGG